MLRWLRIAWYAPLYIVATRSSCRDAIARDAARLLDVDPEHQDRGERRAVLRTALTQPQMRSILQHRLYHGSPGERLAAKLLRRVYPGVASLELNCGDIGPGLVIAHGYASVVWAARIGSDCVIHQQVTVGVARRHTPMPSIGDRVVIWAGAIIVGAITVGDDAQIAAGAVVTRDVPAGATVAGVPARVLKA